MALSPHKAFYLVPHLCFQQVIPPFYQAKNLQAVQLDPIVKCSLPLFYCCKMDSMACHDSTWDPMWVVQIPCKPWSNGSGIPEDSEGKLRVGNGTCYPEYVPISVNGMHRCFFHSRRDSMLLTCPQMGNQSLEKIMQYWRVCMVSAAGRWDICQGQQFTQLLASESSCLAAHA